MAAAARRPGRRAGGTPWPAGDLARSVARLTDAVAGGGGDIAELVGRLKDLKADEAAARRRLDDLDARIGAEPRPPSAGAIRNHVRQLVPCSTRPTRTSGRSCGRWSPT